MGELQEYRLDGYEFADKADYEQAKRESDTIHNIDKKMNLGNPKAALNLYNQAISNNLFKTPVGYAFLRELRTTIISCGLVGEKDLGPIPVGAADGTRGTDGADNSIIKNLYAKEKKKSVILSVAVFALVGIIIAMFVVTLHAKYSYITYFTDYEKNIREEVIDEYEDWEKELEAREKALDENNK